MEQSDISSDALEMVESRATVFNWKKSNTATELQLIDLNNDDLLQIFFYLDIEDINAIQATGNRRLSQIAAYFTNHMLTKYQVALWTMQKKINFFNSFHTIRWPPHIRDLLFISPMFNTQATFVRCFLQVYWPLASIFKSAPPIDTSTYELIRQLCTLTENDLCVDTIVRFVNVAFATLEKLQKLIAVDSKKSTFSEMSRADVKVINHGAFPFMSYYIENFELLNHVSLDRNMSKSIKFVEQSSARLLMVEGIMQNVESVSFNCLSLKHVQDGALKRFPNLVNLIIDLRVTTQLGPLLEHLAKDDRIEMLHLLGYRCQRNDLFRPNAFHALNRCFALQSLTLEGCEFLNETALRVLMCNLINVTFFASVSNLRINEDILINALEMQKNIETVRLDDRMTFVNNRSYWAIWWIVLDAITYFIKLHRRPTNSCLLLVLYIFIYVAFFLSTNVEKTATNIVKTAANLF